MGGGRTIWTDEMTAIAVGMKRAGLPIKAIAARLGVSPASVATKTLRKGAYRHLDHRCGAEGAIGRMVSELVTSPAHLDGDDL